MGVGRVTRRAKEVFISKSVRPYRVSASTVVTLHYCCHPAAFENDGLSEPIFTVFATLVQLRAGPCFAALHMSASDAVDGSSTGTEVPSGLGAVKAPTIRRRSQDANDHSEQSGRLTPQRTAPALLYERTRLFSSSAGRHGALLFMFLYRGVGDGSDQQLAAHEAARLLGPGVGECVGRAALDHAAAMHEHDLAGEALRLAEIVR